MTAQQLEAIKQLAERFGSNLQFTDVVHDPFDLPRGWVSVVVRKPYPYPAPDEVEHYDAAARDSFKRSKLDSPIKVVAGVSPAGAVHT